MDGKNIKKDFPWFANNKGWIYLDSGASSLKPQAVIDSINLFYTKYSFNTHNNDSPLTMKLNLIVKTYRAEIAKFINAQQNEIAFTSGATESMNLIVNNLQEKLVKGDEVIISYGEHTTNLIPWLELIKTKGIKLIYANKKNTYPTATDFINAITSKTKIISFASVSNLFGYQINVEQVVKSAKKINKNIMVIVDATQSIPSEMIDVKKTAVDFMICSAHKMCGPTGIGLVYGKYELLSNFNRPLRLGGGMNGTVGIDHYGLVPIPDRLEGGTLHGAGIFGFRAAAAYLTKIGMKNVEAYLKSLKDYIDAQFKTVKDLEYYYVKSDHPICAFNIQGINPQDLANYLGKKKIIVRAGMSCVKLQSFITNNPTGAVRASFYLYNTKADVDALVLALKTFKKTAILKDLV